MGFGGRFRIFLTYFLFRIQKRMNNHDRNSDRDGERDHQREQDVLKFDNLLLNLQDDSLDIVKNTISLLNTEFFMANESMKQIIKPNRFVGVLLSHLRSEIDASLMVMASNCLLSLIDLFPEISETIVDEKGLKTLEEKGKSFEYIDVAENSVKLLEKIAEN